MALGTRPPENAVALRLALALVTLASWLVPAWHRATWRRQWEADLWAQARYLERQATRTPGARAELVHRAFGVFRHACWLRIRQWSLDMLLQDLRYGVRLLVRRPAFAVMAVLVLALGIGANATIFSWAEALVLRPLPGIPGAERLVVLHSTMHNRGNLSVSYPNFIDLKRDLPPGVEGIVCQRLEPLTMRAGAAAERVWGSLVSGNYFDVLGVKAGAGRTFLADEDVSPGSHPVVVLSHRFWLRRFEGRPDAVGRTVMLNEHPFTVIGVAPEGFQGTVVGVASDLFVPMMMQPTLMGGNKLESRGNSWLKVLVRLGQGTSFAQADAGFQAAAARLQQFAENRGRGLAIYPLWRAPSEASGMMAPVLAVLMAVVGLVLLVACANLAGLLLARTTAREREMAMRLALGAGRLRLVRQLVTENLILAGLGGVGGLLLANWTARLLPVFLPPTRIPLLVDAGISPRVLVFAMVVTTLTGLAVGITPALQSSRTALAPALGGVSRHTLRRSVLRKGLVIGQVALSLLLLVAASLFMRTLNHARAMDVGFSMRQGLLASIDLVPAGYDAARGATFYHNLVNRLRTIPGVKGAAVAGQVPLSLGSSDMLVEIDGYTPAKNEDVDIYYNRVGESYFETMGISVLAGRPIDARDGPDRPGVTVINEAMAKRYWKNGQALGGRIHVGPKVVEVVGIVKTGKYVSLAESPKPYMYLSLYQYHDPSVILHVRTGADPLALAPAVIDSIRAMDHRLPVFDVMTFAEHLELGVFMQRMAATLLGFFGGLALLLATTGLYGVLAFLAAQRTREIGIRMALGADRGSVVWMILRQGLVVTVAGLALGLVLAAGATRLLGSQLIGVGPFDPLSLGATLAVLLSATLLACYLPARRASRQDPLQALRYE